MKQDLGLQTVALLLLINTVGSCAKKTADPDEERVDQLEQAQQENAPPHRLGPIPKKKLPEGLSEKDEISLQWFHDLMELEDYIVAAMACQEIEDSAQKKMCTKRLEQVADELEKAGKDKDGDAYSRYVTELKSLLQGTESGQLNHEHNQQELSKFVGAPGTGKNLAVGLDRLLEAADKSEAQFSQFGCGYRSVYFILLTYRDRRIENYTDFALTPLNPLRKLEPDVRASYTPMAPFASTVKFAEKALFLPDRHRFSTIRTGQTADGLADYINKSKYTKNHLEAELRVLPATMSSFDSIRQEIDNNNLVIALNLPTLLEGWHYYVLVGYDQTRANTDIFLAWNTGDATFTQLDTEKKLLKEMVLANAESHQANGVAMKAEDVEKMLNRNGYKLDKNKMHFIVLKK